MQNYKTILSEGTDLNKWSIIPALCEIDVSTMSSEDRDFYIKYVGELKDNPVTSLHPLISRISDSLAVLTAQPGAQPVVFQALNVHDARLSGARKDGQDFLDEKMPFPGGAIPNAVAIDEFNSIIEEIKQATQKDLDKGEELQLYLDFLKIENQRAHDQHVRLSGAQAIWQVWRMCNQGFIEKPIFFGVLYEAATAYKGADQQFFAGYDYSCHPGMEERIQMMAAQVGASLVSQEDASYSQLASDYLRQGFSLYSTSLDGDRRFGRSVELNEQILPIVKWIAKKKITAEMFEKRKYMAPNPIGNMLKLYTEKEGKLTKKTVESSSSSSSSLQPVLPGQFSSINSLTSWYFENRDSLPKIIKTEIEFKEESLDALTQYVCDTLSDPVGKDRWILNLVFSEGDKVSGSKGFAQKIKEYLELENDDLYSGRKKVHTQAPEPTISPYLQDSIQSLDTCYSQMIHRVSRHLQNGELINLPSPISSSEMDILRRAFEADVTLMLNALTYKHGQLVEALTPMLVDFSGDVQPPLSSD